MTHAAPPRRGGKTWILPVAAVAIVGLLIAFGVLSRSIVLDAVSWWPVWLLLAIVGFWGRGMKVGALRLPGLLSIVTVVVVVVFVFGHLQGWAFMPSSAGMVVGSEDGSISSAALSARAPDGSIRVSPRPAGHLYDVAPIRRGGDVGVPSAVERAQEDDVSITLEQPTDPGWFEWAGWELGLSVGPVWSLTFEGRLDADLTGLAIDNVQAAGGGDLSLGSASRSTPVTLSGDYVIRVPSGTPVRVIGPAEIPEGWERTESGASSPTEGQGWVISVGEGSVVTIREDPGV